ncbi:MAG: phage tail tube protein [Sciscionella sp.]
MATGSGLDAQLGLAAETTWGTAATVDHFVEFNSETLAKNLTFLEPTGLRVGTKFKRSKRVVVSRTSVSGDIDVDHATKGMGLLWKNALASAVAVPTAVTGQTGAYSQVHTPGGFKGLGLTMQVGRPEPSTGVVKPFTYTGCKVSKWEFVLKDNATPTLKLTVDGKDEDTTTTLAAASFISGASVFDFSQAKITLGGTVATTAGVAAVTGGTAMSTIVTDITLDGTTGMDTARYGLGNAGKKAEQLENAFPTLTGKMSAEFNQSELYDVFSANTTLAMQLTLTGDVIGATTAHYKLDFILPAVKLKTAPPNVSGPAIVAMSTTFEAYSDEVNAPIQVTIVSDESTL